MRLLIVEDHPILADGLIIALKGADYAVDHAATGEQADHMLATQHYDAVILDIGLPKLDGYEVLRRMRRKGSKTPVLMLTARDALEDRVKGLDLGADDYLTKPFRLSELEARVRALIRRAHAAASSDLTHGRLRLDMAGRRLYLDDQPMELSLRELAVIELLLLREGKVVTKQQIVDHLYGWEDVSSSNAVEVFIHRLRKKLEDSGVAITTVRGMGYLIEKPNGTGG
jgi:two-component system OmpR family response regulator